MKKKLLTGQVGMSSPPEPCQKPSFENILETINEFRGDEEQSDDLTLLEINADPSLLSNEVLDNSASTATLPYPSNWNMNMMLT